MLSRRIVKLAGMCLSMFGLFTVAQATSAQAADVQAIQEASDSTASRLGRLETAMQNISNLVAQQQEEIALLADDVRKMYGTQSEYQHTLEKITERQRDIYKQLDQIGSLTSSKDNLTTDKQTSAPSKKAPNGTLEKDAYSQAINLVLKEKNYPRACEAFENFIKNYPQSSYSANAHYWLGQLYLNKGDTKKARQSLEVVVHQYQDSTKIPDALLKLGIIEQNLGHHEKAIAYLEQVIQKAPKSASAEIAKQKLASITEKSTKNNQTEQNQKK